MRLKQRFTITKEEINRLPLKYFTGNINLIDTPEKAQKALQALKKETLLGFDTESRPSFKKGQHFPIALIQLAAEKQAFIFQVSRLGVPKGLKRLIEDRRVTKIVQGAEQELADLARDHGLQGRGFFDLHTAAKRHQCLPQGVRGLAALFLDFRFSKSVQRSNWGQKTLTPKQIRYAATDAWVCLKIFQEMKRRGLIRKPLKRVNYTGAG